VRRNPSSTPRQGVERLLDEALAELLRRRAYKTWWTFTRRRVVMTKQPPEPAYQILHITRRSKSTYRKALRDEVFAANKRNKRLQADFWKTVDALHEVGLILCERPLERFDFCTDYLVSKKGERVLALWNRMAGRRWQLVDEARHRRVVAWFCRHRRLSAASSSSR
jgi:hypothetical protein